MYYKLLISLKGIRVWQDTFVVNPELHTEVDYISGIQFILGKNNTISGITRLEHLGEFSNNLLMMTMVPTSDQWQFGYLSILHYNFITVIKG